MTENFSPLTIPGFHQAGREAARFKAVTPTISTTAGGAGNTLGATSRIPACAQIPAIHLERDGDKITHVRLECPCGQVFDLECVY